MIGDDNTIYFMLNGQLRILCRQYTLEYDRQRSDRAQPGERVPGEWNPFLAHLLYAGKICLLIGRWWDGDVMTPVFLAIAEDG